jgi:murein DD-endopeptidase MepM/ murein hydrolase activator NlpD
LNVERERVTRELSSVEEDIAALDARSAARRAIRDRLLREALRLAALQRTPPPSSLTEEQRDVLEELLALEAGLDAARSRLTERATDLGRIRDAVAAKQGQLARLRDRARVLAAAAASGEGELRAAQVEVLQGLAREAAAAQAALAQLIASAMTEEGAGPSAWTLPLRGPITQAFGPTILAMVPGRTYEGAYYAHFHDAIDIAAALGAPVTAAADGRVTYVGHLPDGAMVVLVAHAGGLVSQYAHLDDVFVPPRVRAGDTVTTGQVIGFVGLSGMTTGPHLHFSVTRAGEPIDPLSLIVAQR